MHVAVDEVASTLTSRLGIEIIASETVIDGGRWPSVRPALPAEPNGFSVALAATPKSVTATFHPDRFAKQLLVTMADADENSRASAADFIRECEASDILTLATLDDLAMRSPDDIRGRWGRLDIECQLRLVAAKRSGEPPLIRVASACLGIVLALLPIADELPTPDGLPEGALLRMMVNRYERNPTNRARCIAHYGVSCQACGFSFEAGYGAIGGSYIEVHHLTMVSQLGEGYRVDPTKDLVPLCSNCHAVAHRRTPPYTLDELRRAVGARNTIPA